MHAGHTTGVAAFPRAADPGAVYAQGLAASSSAAARCICLQLRLQPGDSSSRNTDGVTGRL
jgi:hypothetical protein